VSSLQQKITKLLVLWQSLGYFEFMQSVRLSQNWLYPSIEPYSVDQIKVGTKHSLYVEQSGNPDGKPVVFLHGGPGAGTSPDHRRFFDPDVYRIVLFDQRGCGKSTPHASIEENTTWDLVSDIELIREKLKIDRWQVFGGSWGSTLALSYATKHPERISELVLRGIFLARRKELEWFYQEGANQMFPDEWEAYWNHIPADEKSDMIAAYHRRLTSPDEKLRIAAAKIWTRWEYALSALQVDPKTLAEVEKDTYALAFARIEAHYFQNRIFFPTDNFLIENIARYRRIPTTLVQGRYDVVCPAQSAWDLHRHWPEARLHMIPDAGHSAFDAPITRALVATTDRYAASVVGRA
jgi:proline iminopeptidase